MYQEIIWPGGREVEVKIERIECAFLRFAAQLNLSPQSWDNFAATVTNIVTGWSADGSSR